MEAATRVEDGFTSESFLVKIIENKALAKVLCRWKFCEPIVNEDVPQFFHSLDLLLNITPVLNDNASSLDVERKDLVPSTMGTALETLIRTCCTIRASVTELDVVLKVILAPQEGFLCRSDIIDVRMKHAEYVDSVIRLSTHRCHLSAIPSDNERTIQNLLFSSPAALLVKQSPLAYHEALELVEIDLRDRLSFHWVLPAKPAPRKVAMIGGRPLFDWKRESYGSRGPFEAALGLDIAVIVLDRPGHWLEGETYSHLRDDFIAIDVTDETKLPSIIVEAVREKEIDGIVTFSDEYVIATAKAAETLGLPTESVQAILQAHHKDETRKVLDNPNVQVLRLESAKQLDEPSVVESLKALQYPLIVKPCRGGASRGVKKVQDHLSMRQAVFMMEEDGLAIHGILLETYVDGPEVDANIMLWDGELLFSEISDDFPCLADSVHATVDDNFVETLMVLPSRLPPTEIEVLRMSLYQDLLKLGFRTGIFHVEARIQNSSLQYTEIDGILDLTETSTAANSEPWSFLIEVNARPPGLDCVFSTLDTYGVDMCALQYLAAIGDRERFVALSNPFSKGAQYWCGNSQVPIHRENIRVPNDFFEKVLQQLPEISPYVLRAELFTQPGAIVSPRGGAGFIAYFLLYSRKSRRHVLEMSLHIQRVSMSVLDSV